MKNQKGSRALLVAVGVVCVTCGLCAGAASADPVADTITCTFNGVAGNLTPPAPNVSNQVPTLSNGTFSFQGPATCVLTDINATGPAGDNSATSGVYGVQICNTGYYTTPGGGTGDLVGEGRAWAVSSSTNSLSDAARDIGITKPTCLTTPTASWFTPTTTSDHGWTTTGFGVNCNATACALEGGILSPDFDAHSLTGSAQTAPNGTVPCTTSPDGQCVSAFTVTGSFSES
jgi:hypothetical protein